MAAVRSPAASYREARSRRAAGSLGCWATRCSKNDSPVCPAGLKPVMAAPRERLPMAVTSSGTLTATTASATTTTGSASRRRPVVACPFPGAGRSSRIGGASRSRASNVFRTATARTSASRRRDR